MSVFIEDIKQYTITSETTYSLCKTISILNSDDTESLLITINDTTITLPPLTPVSYSASGGGILPPVTIGLVGGTMEAQVVINK